MKIDVDNRIISKWNPIVESFFKYKNKYIVDAICLFCEWYSEKENTTYNRTGSCDGSTLPDKLNDLIEKINTSSRREVITDQVYNSITGIIELKLDSGRYVSPDSTYFELSVDEIIEIFGIDFVKFLNTEELRDNQINKIWQS
jgi:hypothetical protein